ncbi:hypothetical protein C5L14_29440 [Labrys okinawensis]|uniref:Uncharacterized protein n=1 Tax=Labrys okinawensis TaxID=346911 RepID=A0A2S9Q3T7_9HYPH|nr:hypothetical protein [Labrys okinawensis]PRH83989.1 hypothetical protein C5L14_29440 [Labrys okinawensis]
MPNIDQLRARIDQGRNGDKIPFPDPAAAPLGTDDEAADTPPTPERLQMASRHEHHAAEAIGPGATDERSRPLDGRYRYWEQARAMVPLVVGFLIAAFCILIFTWWRLS